VTTLGLP